MAADNAAHPRKLVGYKEFKRSNPLSDYFAVHKFHHVEFWCGDATCTSKRFGFGLGLSFAAKSDQGTGNQHCASYVMKSNDITFVFTAPYSTSSEKSNSAPPLPWYDQELAHSFHKKHGLAVRALGIEVEDAKHAYETSTSHGAIGVQEPTLLEDLATGEKCTVSEIVLYGDVVLRFVSHHAQETTLPYLPNYVTVTDSPNVTFGIKRLDHAVGNVPELLPAVDYICSATGFHEFAEFVAEDVGTIDSGLNSMVLASNNEMVLLPINEPTFNTKRKSQIQTFLEQNEGGGLQHLALKTDDIFQTLREMRSRSGFGGFDFMPRPSDEYYKNLPDKIGGVLTAQQYKECKELGILVDKDDQGVLLQIFTKPLGDRPTVFIEIIQRMCELDSGSSAVQNGVSSAVSHAEEVGGCGGFGKGNFSELFKSIEVYETDLGIN